MKYQKSRNTQGNGFFMVAVLTGFLLCALPSLAQQNINHANLLEYLDNQGKLISVSTPADWYLRRKQILDGMQLAMGNLPDRHDLVDLDIEIVNEIGRASCRERV